MMERLLCGTAIGLAWAFALVMMGIALRATLELFLFGWRLWF